MPEVRTPIEPSEDTVTILVTTDNHVGYKENDPIIGDDAWKTFDEVMSIAKEREVDMVLQSGDLFHINKPTKKSLYQVMRILRLHCLGDKPCELELLSDPSETFDDAFNIVNYEDPNINVSIPVFAISGNHDDSSGNSLLSPMDVLSVTGLVNHFGRVLKNDEITVTPILLQKGTTKLALYGLASVLDERLFRTFRDGGVKFKAPNVRKDEWFNVMAVHQNHVAHTETSYLPETFLPSFLDLVVWGHEHECIPYTVTNYEAGFETLQPGSSVATSLSDKETIEKNVFIVTVKNRDYHVEPIKLKTIRPFVMQDVSLSNSGIMPGPTSRNDVTRFLKHKVESLIVEARKKWKDQNPELFDEYEDGENVPPVEYDSMDEETGERHEKQQDTRYPLPLVRLRVDYSGGYEVENPRRFSNMFVGKVANINDIISFHRKRDTSQSAAGKKVKLSDIQVEENASIKVQSFVNSFLQESNLSLLPEVGINAAVKNFVDKEDRQALETFVERELKNDIKLLSKAEIEENAQLVNFIKHNKKSFSAYNKDNDVDGQVKAAPRATKTSKKRTNKVSDIESSDVEIHEPPKSKKRTRTTAAATKMKPVKPVEIISDSELDEEPVPKKTASRARKIKTRKAPESDDEKEEEQKESDLDVLGDERVLPKKQGKRVISKKAPNSEPEGGSENEIHSSDDEVFAAASQPQSQAPQPAKATKRGKGCSDVRASTRGSTRGRARGARGGSKSKVKGGDEDGSSQSISALLSQFSRG